MKILSTIVALCFTTFLFAQQNNEKVRVNQLFNFDWKFKAGERTSVSAISILYDIN
jgi:beta-galactosidase